MGVSFLQSVAVSYELYNIRLTSNLSIANQKMTSYYLWLYYIIFFSENETTL